MLPLSLQPKILLIFLSQGKPVYEVKNDSSGRRLMKHFRGQKVYLHYSAEELSFRLKNAFSVHFNLQM